MIDAPTQHDPAFRLEAIFRAIAATRMAGMALLNPALDVEAVGFRRRGDAWVGVLITPWFMNLICLPDGATAGTLQASGTRREVELPSGTYEFLSAHEDELGPYLTSSLFSPMFAFPDMARAREMATAVLTEVFSPAAPDAAPAVGLVARLEQPVSRRGFLGALLRPGEKT
ncbi:MAG: [NiFe]-hydrogenase assembly chaperone HybE [Thiobacillus sp.]|jgi:[NiFe] hydrogenase assembly HybE family chaperone